uniref:Tetraspanin n=1 Tax=Echinococcus canadensis TaxID=519352 RepID=A0A915EV11_9CEST
MHEVDLRAEERNAVWLRGLTGFTSIVSNKKYDFNEAFYDLTNSGKSIRPGSSRCDFGHLAFIVRLLIRRTLYSCGCLSYCIYLLLKVEPAILPSLNMLDIQTALTMVTGMAGACGSITLKRGPLLLHCCITTVECLGYLTAGTVALRNRVTIGSRLEMAFNEILKDYIDPNASDEIVHKLHTIQAVLRCCGKNGGQDFIQMERPHPCGRAVSQYGSAQSHGHRTLPPILRGTHGRVFVAASLMTSLRKDS